MNSLLNSALRQAARNLSIDYRVAERVYYSYFKFIRQHIESLPLKTQDEVDEDTNFNIPYIGKLYVDKELIQKYKRQLKFYEDVKDKKNKADRQPGTGK